MDAKILIDRARSGCILLDEYYIEARLNEIYKELWEFETKINDMRKV